MANEVAPVLRKHGGSDVCEEKYTVQRSPSLMVYLCWV